VVQESGVWLHDAYLNSKLRLGEREYTEAQVIEELLADFTCDALTDPVFLQRLADNNSVRYIHDAVTTIKGCCGSTKRKAVCGSNPFRYNCGGRESQTAQEQSICSIGMLSNAEYDLWQARKAGMPKVKRVQLAVA
jgi:hypothetical protein